MRLMRSHNLAYFRWFFGAQKIPPAHRCTNGISCLFRRYKCVLCDRMKWYQNTFVFINHNKTVRFRIRYS